MTRPILYSFRRCPYAMRARLAIWSSGVETELREVLLRDKASAFLEASPKGTVPVLVLPDGVVLEQSLDVMDWALGRSDPENMLHPQAGSLREMRELVDRCETEFKPHLDRFKYHVRYGDVVPEEERTLAAVFLHELHARLESAPFLFGERISFADIGIVPFVRQFANCCRDWFEAQDWPVLLTWLQVFEGSDRFAQIMAKYPMWRVGDSETFFGGWAGGA